MFIKDVVDHLITSLVLMQGCSPLHMHFRLARGKVSSKHVVQLVMNCSQECLAILHNIRVLGHSHHFLRGLSYMPAS